MQLKWTKRAFSDLTRLHGFLASANPQAAARTVQSLTAAPARLREQPQLGERLEEFAPRDVRRLLVGQYEMRYEIHTATVYILRLWRTREQR